MSEQVYKRFWSKVDVRGPTECWNWKAGVAKGGYGQFHLAEKNCVSSRLAFEFVGGTLGKGMMACHHCDNPRCCNPNHLYAGTAIANSRDMINRKRGKCAKGESHPNRKLTEEKVLEIRKCYRAGESPMEISRRFGFCDQHICRIVHYKAWKHLR